MNAGPTKSVSICHSWFAKLLESFLTPTKMVPFTWRFFVTFLGWLSDPFKGLNDLQLGDEKVTLNHLAPVKFSGVSFFAFCNQITRRFFFFHVEDS